MAFTLGRLGQAELDLEKRIVRSELALRQRSLTSFIWRHRARALYGALHPFTPREDDDDVDAVDLRGAQWFFQAAYRPDNATLVIVGNFATAEARGFIAKYFGPIKNPPITRLQSASAPPPKLCGSHAVRVGHPFILGKHIELDWPIGGRPSAAQAAGQRLVALLLQQRLEEELVRGSFTVAELGVGLLRHRTHGFLRVRLELQDTDEWEHVERVTRREARRLASELITEQELHSAKLRFTSNYVFSRRSGPLRALSLLEGLDADEVQRATEALTTAAVRQSAQLLAGSSFSLRAEPTRAATGRGVVLDEQNPCR
jgi:predicted Zn-dependent peptidase